MSLNNPSNKILLVKLNNILIIPKLSLYYILLRY